MTNPLPITIKWGKQKIVISDVFAFQTGKDLKEHLSTETNVPVQRQTITGLKKGLLKDDEPLAQLDAARVEKNSKRGMIRMMGSAEKVPQKTKDVKFVEDVVQDESDIYKVKHPPGLTNLGNTCYMNSSIQLLRAIPEYKDALDQYTGQANSSSVTEKITASLRDLYKRMDSDYQEGKYEVTPHQFVSAFRQAYPMFSTSEQTPLGRVYSQQDAEEFLNTLVNASISELRKVDPKLNSLFVGELDVKLTNQETEEESKNFTEDFHSLKCFIKKETKHLLEGLRDGLQGTVERHSDKLQRNAVYSREARVSKLPKYLKVNFNRFYFKKKEKVQNKIIKRVKFPVKLDAMTLCTDELQKKIMERRKAVLKKEEKDQERKRKEMTKEARELQAKEEAERAKRKGEKVQETKQEDKMDTSDDDVTPIEGPVSDYELMGLVTHKGREIASGHYVGWVKEESSGRWLKFDDDICTEVKQEEILALSGGGDWDLAYVAYYKLCDT